MIKIAILTANIGGIDNVFGMPEQSIPSDFFHFHDGNLPYPLPNLNDRLKSKYVKIQTHRFLPDYDLYIWIDGRVEILSKDFVKEMLCRLGIKDEDYSECNDIAIFKHQERSTVYQEMEFILSKIKKGNKYLVSRYANQNLQEELDFYKKEGLPEDFQLFGCGVFARWNSPHVNAMFDEWWLRSIEFSYFDQAMFSYAAWKHVININALTWDPIRTTKEIKYHPHKK